MNVAAWSNGSSSAYPGYSRIYGPAVPGSNPNDYEVKSAMSVRGPGGVFAQLARPSASAVQLDSGSSLAVPVDLSTCTDDYTSNSYAWLSISQRQGGVTTEIGGTYTSLHPGKWASPAGPEEHRTRRPLLRWR